MLGCIYHMTLKVLKLLVGGVKLNNLPYTVKPV